jgi:chromosomal replication initiation ATPase DnaA
MTPRVRQYAAEEAMRAGVLPADVLRKRVGHAKGQAQPHPAKAARQAVMRRLRADGFTLTQIGRWFGVDHTTVIYWTRNAT